MKYFSRKHRKKSLREKEEKFRLERYSKFLFLVGVLPAFLLSIIMILKILLLENKGFILDEIILYLYILAIFWILVGLGPFLSSLVNFIERKRERWSFFELLLYVSYVTVMFFLGYYGDRSVFLFLFDYRVPFQVVLSVLFIFLAIIILVFQLKLKSSHLEREVIEALETILAERKYFWLELADEDLRSLIDILTTQGKLSSAEETLEKLIQDHLSGRVDFVKITMKERRNVNVVCFLKEEFTSLISKLAERVERLGVLPLISAFGGDDDITIKIPLEMITRILLEKNASFSDRFVMEIENETMNGIFLISRELRDQLLETIVVLLEKDGVVLLLELSRKFNVSTRVLVILVKNYRNFLEHRISSSYLVIGKNVFSLTYVELFIQELELLIREKKVVLLEEVINDFHPSDVLKLIQGYELLTEKRCHVLLSCDARFLCDLDWFQVEFLGQLVELLEKDGSVNLSIMLQEYGLPSCELRTIFQQLSLFDDSLILYKDAIIISRKQQAMKIQRVFKNQHVEILLEDEILGILNGPREILPSIIEYLLRFMNLPLVRVEGSSHQGFVLKLLTELQQLVRNIDNDLVRTHELAIQFQLEVMKVQQVLLEQNVKDRWIPIVGTDLLLKKDAFSLYHPIGDLIADVLNERMIEIARIKSAFGNVIDGNAVIRHVLFESNRYVIMTSSTFTIRQLTVSSLHCDFHDGEVDGDRPFYACEDCGYLYCQDCFLDVRSVAMDSCINCGGNVHRYPLWCPRCYWITLPIGEKIEEKFIQDEKCSICGTSLRHDPLPRIINSIKSSLVKYEKDRMKKAVQLIDEWKERLDTEIGDLLRDLSHGYPVSINRIKSTLKDWRLGIIVAWKLVIDNETTSELRLVLGRRGTYFQSKTFEWKCSVCDGMLTLKEGYVQCRHCERLFCRTCLTESCPTCGQIIYLKYLPLSCNDCLYFVLSFPSSREEDGVLSMINDNCPLCAGPLGGVNLTMNDDMEITMAAIHHARRRLVDELYERLVKRQRELLPKELEELMEQLFPDDVKSSLLEELRKKMHFQGFFLILNERKHLQAVALSDICQVCYDSLEWDGKAYSCRSCGRYVCFKCKKPRSRCVFCNETLRVFPVECPTCQLDFLSPLDLVKRMRCPQCQRKCRPIKHS